MQDDQDDKAEEFKDAKSVEVNDSHSVKNASKDTSGSTNQSVLESKNYSQKGVEQGLFVWTADHLINATQAVKGQWWTPDSTNELNETKFKAKTALANAIEQNPQDSTSLLEPNHSNNLNYPSLKATRIITDTRKIEQGDIFLAIVGEKFDAHDFLTTATEKGAIAAVVSRIDPQCAIPQLLVEDTRLAFGQIAAYRRQQHKDLKVVAITGSSGKTTVKEMLRSIFMQAEKAQTDNDDLASSTLVTRGNLNNDFGVPMMLLELKKQHQYAVLELGANHVGEIAYTSNIVQPDVACILNIGTAHLGEFGGRDNIARTKAEIYQSLNSSGYAVVPSDDEYSEHLRNVAIKHTPNIINYGWLGADSSVNANQISSLPEVYATEVKSSATQNEFKLHIETADIKNEPIALKVNLPMPGQHNVSNALAAASCAYAVGISPQNIADGLSQAQSTKGRLARLSIGIHNVIDDTYNANPNSVRAAADVLAAQSGEKILVLGDIGELGNAAHKEHEKLGQAIATKNIDRLFCVGTYASDTVKGAQSCQSTNTLQQAEAFVSKPELLSVLKDLTLDRSRQNKSCTILFKGSRSATIETLIDDLIEIYAKEFR